MWGTYILFFHPQIEADAAQPLLCMSQEPLNQEKFQKIIFAPIF
jgi:hypothetical protein